VLSNVNLPITIVSSGLFNPLQSAYCKHHFTETALGYCISMIISSMLLDHRSCHVVASLIFLPLSTPLTITS